MIDAVLAYDVFLAVVMGVICAGVIWYLAGVLEEWSE